MAEILTAVDRELSLTHLLQVVQSRWRLIVVVGVLAGLLNTVVFFFIPPLYESTATILVSQTRSKVEPYSGEPPVVESDTYALALQKSDVLLKLIQEFNLDQPPFEYDLDDVRQVVAIWSLRRENSLQVRVQLRDITKNTPELAAGMANFFLEEADRIATDLLQEDIHRSMTLYDREYERARKDLEEIRQRYQEVKLKDPTEQKRKEIDSLGTGLSKMLELYGQAQFTAVQKSAQVAALEALLSKEPPVIPVRRSLDEEPAFMNVSAARTGVASGELYSATSNLEEANLVYNNLRELRDTAVGELAGASAALSKMPESIDVFSQRLLAANLVLNASMEAVTYWEEVLKTAQAGFLEVYKLHKTAVMAIASDRQDLLSWARAYPPLKPAGLPRALLVLAAAVLAMTLLSILVLLIEVIRTTVQRRDE